MPRMALKSGIIDVLDLWMTAQEAGDGHRARVLETHAQDQRLEASVQQKSRVRIERAAEMVELLFDLRNERCLADDGSPDDVGMPVEIFGGAVDREVKTVFGRPKVDRAREGIVDRGDESSLLGESRDSLELTDIQ